ncbi:MAG: pseudouridylate synthase [Acidobacteria bacterium]|nr:MAG: pseudouridylate synthase [Acidobacteriota bacterium]
MTARARQAGKDRALATTRAGRVALNRALSKLGVLSRSEATAAVLNGRVRVAGRVEDRPARLVVPEEARLELDGRRLSRAAWRSIILYKPRGVLTTKRDPEGRPTVYEGLGAAARGLRAVGRLDRATSGLLLLTTDSRLANWILDPAVGIARVYLTTVRGRVSTDDVATMLSGMGQGRDRLWAAAVRVVKQSGRESQLLIELREGRNREVRRLCEAAGHEVTRLTRVGLGGLELGRLKPGEWREVTRAELRHAFPGAPL